MANTGESTRSKVRQRIDKAMEAADDERHKKLLQQRLELARSGLVAYQRHQLTEAVNAFHAYIRILEEDKNVSEGHLTPIQFDIRKDITELMVISGVYWDLVKLYDRTTSADKQKEFLHYLEKYIVFSKGMPFQAFCAETLRKYLTNERPVHLQNFKDAYHFLSPTHCFIVSSLSDVIAPETLPIFRDFRDQVLKQHRRSRSWVAWYYRRGPIWAAHLQAWPFALRWLIGKFFNFICDRLAHFLALKALLGQNKLSRGL